MLFRLEFFYDSVNFKLIVCSIPNKKARYNKVRFSAEGLVVQVKKPLNKGGNLRGLGEGCLCLLCSISGWYSHGFKYFVNLRNAHVSLFKQYCSNEPVLSFFYLLDCLNL